jgi:glycine dehydrogenase subunit 1
LKETAALCTRKAHYAAEQLAEVASLPLRFDRPFFKEFTLAGRPGVDALLAHVLQAGYHGGLHLDRWYPSFVNCLTVAVTEKRTKAEIDGLVAAVVAAIRPR